MTDIEVKIQEKIDEYIGGILAKDQITHDDYRALHDHLSNMRLARMTSAMTAMTGGYGCPGYVPGGDVA